MKLFFQHTAGRITNVDWQYTPVYATFDKDEHEKALQTGWLPHEYEEPLWFQARQERYALKDLEFVKKHKIPARIDFEISHSLKNWDKYEEIWETYLKKKNFPPTFKLTDLFEINPESKMVIELYDYDELVAFSVIRMDPGPVSLQFAWTYHEPKLSLGTHCQYFELYYLSGCGFHYNYVCPGYERTCIWKSRFPGFEFWTGSKWSRDKKVYTELCITDSEIKDVDDLDKVGDLPLEMSSNKYMEWS